MPVPSRSRVTSVGRYSTTQRGEYVSPVPSYSDDDYMEQIAQYKNQSWYDRLLENPWLASKQRSFEPNFWQQLGESVFGDYSARQNYYAGLQQNRSQWLADMLQQLHQQDYNEPVNQVSRERAAGLNPDLTGNISPGSAAENDQSISNVGMPGAGEGTIPEVFNIGMSVVSTAMQVVSGFQGVKSAMYDNDIKQLALVRGLDDSVSDIVKGSVGEFSSGLSSTEEVSQIFSPSDKDGGIFPVVKDVRDRIDRMPFSNRVRKRLKRMANDFITDDEGSYSSRYQSLVNTMLTDLHNSRNAFTESYGKIGADNGNQSAMRFMAYELYKPLNQLSLEVNILNQRIQKDYSSKALEIGLPDNKAVAEDTSYKLHADIQGVKQRVTSSFERIRKKIISESSLSPTWKLALELGLSSVEGAIFSRLITGF